MKNNFHRELPIRSKVEMAQDVAEVLGCLHRGERSHADLLLEDLKVRSVGLDESIQQDVLMFAEQVQFQYAYDPWHRITREVQRAADRLLEDLGMK
jgi:hypothetical protein